MCYQVELQPLFFVHSFTSFRRAKQLPSLLFSFTLLLSATMVSVMSSAQVRSLRRASLEAIIVRETDSQHRRFARRDDGTVRRRFFFFFPRSSLSLSPPVPPQSLPIFTSISGHAPRDEVFPIR